MRWRFGGAKDDGELEKFARELLLEEYKTLRTEAHSALAYAQAIVRWSFAVYGVVIAAALVASSRVTAGDAFSFEGTATLLLFGFALPGVSWAASWTWIGELTRMERAGAYMRGIENRVAALPGMDAIEPLRPLRWETFIGSSARAGTPMGKRKSAYMGTAAVFFGSATIPLALLFAEWVQLFGWNWVVAGFPVWLWPAAATLFWLGCMAWALISGVRLLELGRHTVGVEEM